MRAMHSLWREATDDMDAAMANHVERPGVLPIAFTLFHMAGLEDRSLVKLAGRPPLFSQEWADRIQLGVPDHGKERSVEEMMGQRIGDYDAFRDYQRAVFGKTEAWLSTLDPGSLAEVLKAPPFPPDLAHTFSARAAGRAGITRWDGIECWVFQHGIRHMGELEHARALVGLGGLTY
jgi:DinB family protein